VASFDGLPEDEGCFLPCSFWLAEALALVGRPEDGHAVIDRVLALRNDLGLFAEEYDPRAGRLLGNFPQAFTHLTFVNAAYSFAAERPVERLRHRGQRGQST
jgi:GH15 family glucan-1,4-alpha-glucosidase